METKPHDCKEELRRAGSRATPGRVALLRVLEREHAPLTVPHLHRKLPTFNEVTLYRALDALTAAGLVRKGVGGDRISRYEYAGKPHHHHLVCSDCGYAKTCPAC